MEKINRICILGDAMIPSSMFQAGYQQFLSPYVKEAKFGEWESDWQKLQYRRLEVEKRGPEIESVPEMILAEGKDSEIAIGLFAPMSSKLMDAMPNLKIIGVCRAGLENVNVEEATRRGILVFNVKGRNAEAVSDFTVGMMLSEARNIARAHYAIKTGTWRKTFSNSDSVIELKNKTIGLVGFGFIGQLVAEKLSGFKPNIVVYDPFITKEFADSKGVGIVDKEELFRISDIVTVHARLTDETKGMIDKKCIDSMKKTAYFLNTARAGLVDYKALVEALKEKRIAGAAIDVFETEPLPSDDGLLSLDNVTLTTHIAGTTSEALSNSPGLLMEDIKKMLLRKNPAYLVNPEVLENPSFNEWFSSRTL
jgi:D-3-phosphoglycerate dehydrogenase